MMGLTFMMVFVGFMMISLSMNRHSALILTGRYVISLTQKLALHLLGFICLLTAAVLCIDSLGVGLGLVYWVSFLTFAALFQLLLLSYRPHWVLPLGLMSALAGFVLGVIWSG
ncbi:MAG: DUF3325 domain-containing protein [Cycloclasticus sp.]